MDQNALITFALMWAQYYIEIASGKEDLFLTYGFRPPCRAVQFMVTGLSDRDQSTHSRPGQNSKHKTGWV